MSSEFPEEEARAKLRRMVGTWRGEEAVWRVYERFVERERVEQEFGFLMVDGVGRDEGKRAWFGECPGRSLAC